MIPYAKEKLASIDSFLGFAESGKFPEWPLEIFLEISNVCNLKCAMCNTFSALSVSRKAIVQGKRRGFMDIEDITQPMESLLEHALQVHAFGFGEPTIHPDFREIIDYLSKYGVMVDFFTNGMQLDDDMCEFLVSRKVSKITISISGADKSSYENIYIGGKFDEVLAGIKRLAQLKKRHNVDFPVIDVNSIAFVHHIEKLPEFVELMGESGVSVVHVKPLATFDTIKELHGLISVPKADIELKIIERARTIAERYGMVLGSKPYEALASEGNDAGRLKHRGRGEIKSEYVPLEKIAEIASQRRTNSVEGAVRKDRAESLNVDDMETVGCSGVPCLEPFKTFYVAFSGDVYPCCFKNSRASIGNVKDEKGEDIWGGATFKRIRENIAERREYPAVLCKGCLTAKTYPQGHAIAHKLKMYDAWVKAFYGKGLPESYLERAKEVRPNKDFFTRHPEHEIVSVQKSKKSWMFWK